VPYRSRGVAVSLLETTAAHRSRLAAARLYAVPHRSRLVAARLRAVPHWSLLATGSLLATSLLPPKSTWVARL
jgi:hypothetical protein